MLKKMEIKDFDQVYTLMEESFPKDEYRDYQKQKELFQNPEYQILIEKNPEFREIKALRGTFRSQSGIEKWRRRKQDAKSIDRRRRKNDHSGSRTSDRRNSSKES